MVVIWFTQITERIGCKEVIHTYRKGSIKVVEIFIYKEDLGPIFIALVVS